MNAQQYREKMIANVFVQRAVDEDGSYLGWVVAALNDEGSYADYLVLDQFQSEWEAWSTKQEIQDSFIADRRMLSKCSSSSEIWEWISSDQDNPDKKWTILDHQNLQAFRDEQYVLHCPAEHWHPRPLFPSLY